MCLIRCEHKLCWLFVFNSSRSCLLACLFVCYFFFLLCLLAGEMSLLYCTVLSETVDVNVDYFQILFQVYICCVTEKWGGRGEQKATPATMSISVKLNENIKQWQLTEISPIYNNLASALHSPSFSLLFFSEPIDFILATHSILRGLQVSFGLYCAV